MKQTMQKIAIALCMALAFAACKNDDPETGGGVETVTIDGVATVEVNKKITLTAQVEGTPKNNTYTWNVAGDTTAVTYTQTTGKTLALTGRTEGKVTVTVTVDGVKSKAYSVTVIKTNSTNEIKIELDQTAVSLGVGGSATLKASINGVASSAVEWQSSDTAVATVDSNGKVTAVKVGTATITATANADKTKKATCTVKVEGADVVQPANIAVSPTSLSLKEGDTNTLTATIDNADKLDADHKKITWTSSDPSVATVSSAQGNTVTVTAVSVGTAKITAKTTNEKEATCTVTVTAQTTSPVAASDDEWNFVGKTDAPYSNLGTPKTEGNGKDAQTLDNDISVKGDKNQLTLVLSKTSTDVGLTKTAPKYKYDSTSGLCIKGAALKIDNVKGVVKVTIEWYLGGSSDRNLEVTVGNGEPETRSSGTTVGDKTAYTDTFDGGNGTTLYIGASNELYIKSITITPQSGSGTPPSTPTDPDHSDKTISLTDAPLGYASKGTTYKTSGGTTVTNRADLLSAISKGGVIIINGMIDMSDGKLPATGRKSTDSTSALDALVHNTYSKYANYAAWVKAYSEACSLTTDDGKSGLGNSALQAEVAALNKAYGDLIKLTLKSGTTLIGKGPNCGIRGGTIQISSVSNIQIRNLTIQDAFDPFPHHEVNSKGETDGYNAQWDGINIQGTCENIWIDHVTFEDTMTLDYVYTSGTSKEKWQTYDGLCDMKNDSTNITISNCIFRNHDKTMLIGSSDTDGDNTKRFVTLQGNYFYNCGQRLPMVRNTTIHILNNYYNADSNAVYKNSYAVGCRETSIIYAEANYFDAGIQYSFDNNQGTVHASGDKDNSAKKMNKTTIADSALFSSAVKAYAYTPVTAEQAKTNAMSSAGAGYTLK